MNSFSPALQQFLTYVATKSHTLNLDQHTFTRVLAEECGDVLLAFRDVFLERNLDITFLIAWNDLRKHWNESTPFLTSPSAKKSILKYMVLKGRFGIAGSTQFVFDRRRAPALVVIFSLGDDFAIASELKAGLDILRVTLPMSGGMVPETYRALLNDEFNEDSIVFSQSDIGGAYYLRIDPISNDNGKELFHKRTEGEVIECKEAYRSFLIELSCRLSEPDSACVPTDNDLVTLHESLALIYPLLREAGADRELAYLFNSANIYASFDAYTDELKDGGCLCVMGPKQNMFYSELYVGASLTFSRFSAAQKRFRIYFERQHAVRSAVAAIMARNMSHNIGSHALWYRAEDLHRGENLDPEKSEAFVRYLQKRMDFIAHIATSSPAWSQSIGWDQIRDGIEDQSFLLDNIARSEKITGDKLQVNLGERHDDLRLSVPHAGIGTQAFYSILENLIRNAAKSGNPNQLQMIRDDASGEKRLQIDVAIESSWDDGGTGWSQDYFRVKIRDNLTTPQSVVDKLNEYLERSIGPKEQGANTNVGSGQWGMKEIKICAAYLRMVRQEELDAAFDDLKDGCGDRPPIIRAELENKTVADDDAVGNLTYVLYLGRPKEAIIVGVDVPDDSVKLFAAGGIDVETWEGVRRTVDSGRVLSHQFLCGIAEEQDMPWLIENINHLPHRVILLGREGDNIPGGLRNRVATSDVPPGDTFSKKESVLKFMWRTWSDYWWSEYVLAVRSDKGQDGAKAESQHEQIPEKTFSERDDPSGTRLLLFDHRGTPPPDVGNNKAFTSSAFHQCVSGGEDLYYLLRATNEPWTRGQLKESAAVKVGILDERLSDPAILQHEASYGSGKLGVAKNTRVRDAWLKRRVWITDTDEALENFCGYVQRLRNEHKQFDFFIIHQGIIDRIKKISIPLFEEGWWSLKEIVRWMVIDTGRGRPEQAAEDGLPWVEYSNISDVVIQRAGDKRALTQLLFALKPEPGISSVVF